MTADRRAAGGRLPRLRARARGEPEGVDVSHLPRHALLREQDALQDPRRRGLSDARPAASTKAPASYFHVSPDEVWIGGGMYAPQTPQLHAVREHIAANVRQLRSIVESPGFRRVSARSRARGCSACRAGFPRDHPAAEYLKYRQFLAGAEFPADVRHQPEVLRHAARRVPADRAAVRFLNPLLPASDGADCVRSPLDVHRDGDAGGTRDDS